MLARNRVRREAGQRWLPQTKTEKNLGLGKTHRWCWNSVPRLNAIEEVEVEEIAWSCEVHKEKKGRKEVGAQVDAVGRGRG